MTDGLAPMSKPGQLIGIELIGKTLTFSPLQDHWRISKLNSFRGAL
jgi:hypothetical protein